MPSRRHPLLLSITLLFVLALALPIGCSGSGSATSNSRLTGGAGANADGGSDPDERMVVAMPTMRTTATTNRKMGDQTIKRTASTKTTAAYLMADYWMVAIVATAALKRDQLERSCSFERLE